MKDFVTRLMTEREEVRDRKINLEKFLKTDVFKGLSGKEQYELEQQFEGMDQYYRHLDRRTYFYINNRWTDESSKPEQQVILNLSSDDGEELKVNLSFAPGIAGENSDWFVDMNDVEKLLQHYAVDIANKVMQSLKREHAED